MHKDNICVSAGLHKEVVMDLVDYTSSCPVIPINKAGSYHRELGTATRANSLMS